GAHDSPACTRSTIKPWPPFCVPPGSGPTTMCFSYGVDGDDIFPSNSWMEMLSFPQLLVLCQNGVQKAHACLASRSPTQAGVCAAHGQVLKTRW
ncbi:unnamed protein product, partial [Ectocarpus sp. 13 AM-2016]